ncbi:protein PELOTA 2-like [Macadamia integrifolia]|uniref:protein PELOTA 2-like n=1 Tax=Macadamia integrifolia TaxID=60698 RepID=UPI001C4F93CA|nr:protein PELOTA 2-like [Macadamia integrifolia]
MKFVRKNLVPNGPGSVKMIPEEPDDLWLSYNLITEGDTVMAVTMQLVREKLDEMQKLYTDFKSTTHSTFNYVISAIEQQVDEPEDESLEVEDEIASFEVEDPLVEDFKSADLFSEPIDFIFPSHYFINELRVVDFISFDLGFDGDFI